MISAIVLAAGASTRYGGIKQLQLLARVLANVRASRVDEAVVVLGAHIEAIRGAVPLDGVRGVVNPDYAHFPSLRQRNQKQGPEHGSV